MAIDKSDYAPNLNSLLDIYSMFAVLADFNYFFNVFWRE